jgi:hypothetical protein
MQRMPRYLKEHHRDSSRTRAAFRVFKFGLQILLLVIVRSSAPAQVTDLAIDTSGPHHVVQGHYMFFLAQARILAGTDQPGTVSSVSGLPSGATADFVNIARFCCGTSLWSTSDGNPIKISTSSTTPVGTYPLVITYTTPQGVQRSTTYTIYVDPVPSLVHKSGTYFPPDTPLSSLAQWQSNRTTYGRKHCNQTEMAWWDGNVWFYDGARVYYQIADQTGDPSWNTCAQMVANFYQQHVLTVGVPAGYYIFSQGLAMNYQRTGDPVSRQVVAELGQEYYAQWPDVKYVISWMLSREVSYGIEAAYVDQSLGGTLNPHFQDLIEILLGHFDQWFLSKNSDYTQPFMVALGAEALINYYNVSHDPRIPPMLQLAADQLWTQSWDPSSQSFRYYNGDGTSQGSLDLNLLIAPLYGWVYQQTGFQGYRDMGDQIFNGGVAGAWLDGGKQFSQSYRWSAKYLEWRTLAASTAGQTSPTVSCDLNSDGKVNVLDVQLATNQTLGYAACGSADLNGDGKCTIIDVQRIISASLGAACHLGP